MRKNLSNIAAFFDKLLRRNVANGEYIAVIDGFRFIAVFWVILYHILIYLTIKSGHKYLVLTASYDSFYHILRHSIAIGSQGVELFFVISGLVIALPFARFYKDLSSENGLKTPLKQGLKDYFLRRLMRIEPPYFITMCVLYFFAAFVLKKHSLVALTKSLLASLIYSHNLIFPYENGLINAVAWTLEIEIQFYVLAPFLLWAFYALLRKKAFLGYVFLGILGSIPHIFPLSFEIILGFSDYFIAGILVAHFYTLNFGFLARFFATKTASFLGLFLLLLLLNINFMHHQFEGSRIVHPFTIGLLYSICLGNPYLKKWLSFSFIPVLGGMCYSLYLWHSPAISFIGRFTMPLFSQKNLIWFSCIQNIIFLAAIIFVSSLFFIFIEKPFMKWKK